MQPYMQTTDKTQHFIDELLAAGIHAVKVNTPLVPLSIGTEQSTVPICSRMGTCVEDGIQFIIDLKPVVVFVKDVYIENEERCVFRFQTITM